MFLFEICPQCSQIHKLTLERMRPMVLSGNDKKMQCGVCGHSYLLRKTLILAARGRRSQ